ncbi:MAG: 2-phospho-L-lactate guanylyltransferase [Actinomycetota bacterium]|nr:2-phospho-L-lactate guanylyltransferase [Actinomycetota bacterium]
MAASAGGLQLGPRAVLIPVKDFSVAKLRLAPALSPDARAQLARAMAEQVVRAAQDLPVAVVCDDTAVANWARSLGALVVWAPERGLNHAVQDGMRHLASLGVTQVTVAHADLPFADDLTWVSAWPGVTLIPDRRDDGTTVIGLPTGCGFVFSYGPGSFGRHLAEAQRLELPIRVERSPALAFDVDVPIDLAAVSPTP